MKNVFKYHQIFPPNYDLGKVVAPVALHYSRNDWLAGVSDVYRLYEELGNPIGKFQVLDEKFNHLDFLWGNDAHELVYPTVLHLMMQY